MAQAFKIIDRCRADPIADATNITFKAGLRKYWGLDPLSQFNQKKWAHPLNYKEKSQFYKDQINPFAKPGIPAKRLVNMDMGDIKISTLEDWSTELDDMWRVVWRRTDGTVFDWLDKDFKLNSAWSRWYSKWTPDGYYSMPIWYPKVKRRILEFLETPEFLSQFSADGVKDIVEDFNAYFRNIEMGNIHGARWTELGSLVWWNHANIWRLLAVGTKQFQRMLNDQRFAEKFLWHWTKFISGTEYRDAMQSIAKSAGRRRGGTLNIFTQLPQSTKNKLYDLWFVSYEHPYSIDKKSGDTDVIVEWHYDYQYFENFEKNFGRDATYRHIHDLIEENFTPFKKFKDWVDVHLVYNIASKIDSFFWKVVSPVVYGLLMFVSNGIQWAYWLLSLNSTMFMSDAVKGIRRDIVWTNHEWLKFADDYKILTSMDTDQIPYLTLNNHTMWDFIVKSYSMTKSAVMNGLFNITDSLMQPNFKVQKMYQFFKVKFPHLESLVDLRRELEMLSPTSREALVSQARDYVEYAVRLETTNSPNVLALSDVYSTKNLAYQPIADMRYKMYNFFAGRWKNKTKWAIQILKDGIQSWKSPSRRQLLDMASSKTITTKEMNELIDNLYLKNLDLINLVYKFKSALLLSNYTDRMTETKMEKEQDSLLWDIADVLRLVQMYDGTVAGFESTPGGRIAMQFAEMLFCDLDNDGTPNFDVRAALSAAAREFVRSSSRWAFLFTGTMEGLAKYFFTNTDANMFQEVWSGIQRQSSGFLYYLRNSLDIEGFQPWIIHGPKYALNVLLWVQPDEIREYMEMNKKRTYSLLWKDPGETLRFFMYWPGVRWFTTLGFDDRSGLKPALTDFFLSKEWSEKLVHWEIPDDMTEQEYIDYYNSVFNRTRSALDEDNWNDYSMKVDYSFEDENFEKVTNWINLRQENIFNTLLQEWLTEDQAQMLTYYLGQAKNGYSKEAMRTLWYIISSIPGAGLQALSYVMYSEYYNALYKSGVYWDGPIPDEIKNKLKAGIWERYADYAFHVDKQNVFPQLVLNYAQTHGYDLWDYVLDWSGRLKISFNWEWQDAGMYQLTLMEMYAQILTAQWEVDWHKVYNVFSTLLEPGGKYVNADGSIKPVYAERAMNSTLYLMDYIDKMPISDSEKQYAKMGMLLPMDKMLAAMIQWKYKWADGKVIEDNRAFLEQNEAFQDTLKFLFGTVNELEELALEYAENNYEKAKGWSSGGYYGTGRYGPNYYSRYQDNKYLIDQLANMAKKYSYYRNFMYLPRDFHQRAYSKMEYKQMHAQLSNIAWLGWGSSGSAARFINGMKEAPGGSKKQLSGKSRPFTKTEDPDKPIEFSQRQWRHRARRTKAVDVAKFGSAWKRAIEGKTKF